MRTINKNKTHDKNILWVFIWS